MAGPGPGRHPRWLEGHVRGGALSEGEERKRNFEVQLLNESRGVFLCESFRRS